MTAALLLGLGWGWACHRVALVKAWLWYPTRTKAYRDTVEEIDALLRENRPDLAAEMHHDAARQAARLATADQYGIWAAKAEGHRQSAMRLQGE